MDVRDAIIAEARRWTGTPWRHLGRGPPSRSSASPCGPKPFGRRVVRRTGRHGLDCAGLPIVVAQALGLAEYEPGAYPPRPDGTFLRRFAEGGCVSKPITQARPGDILIFAESGVPCHCGVMTTLRGEPAVIHAHAQRRRVIEETLESARSVVGRPARCYRFPGVDG